MKLSNSLYFMLASVIGVMPSCFATRCGDDLPRCDGEVLVQCIEDLEVRRSCGGGVCNADTASCCGDNTLEDGEVCDDGNTAAGDGCRADCSGLEACGDEEIDVGEACDDGNNIAGDGCRADCLGEEECGDTLIDTAIGEECDEGDANNGDGCSSICLVEFCGDRAINNNGSEQCDDGGNVDGDGCNAQCRDEFCGDGIINDFDFNNNIANEQCDDGNNVDDDGCDSDCTRTILSIAAGNTHTCVLLKGGRVRCWGEAGSGQLGYGNTDDIGDDEPASAAINVPLGLGGEPEELSAGANFTCVRLLGIAKCWGGNAFGQLGRGDNVNLGDDEDLAIAGFTNIFNGAAQIVQLSTGSGHSCVLSNLNTVRCWGFGSSGQLGYGNLNNIGDNEFVFDVGDVNVGAGEAIAEVTPGSLHTCVRTVAGNVRCWGEGNSGRLGYGNNNDIGVSAATLPNTVGNVDVGDVVQQVVLTELGSCALVGASGDRVRCWGGGFFGIGYGNTNNIGDDEAPSSAGDVNIGGAVAQLAKGPAQGHYCALLTNGNVRCWGQGFAGNLGYGNTFNVGDNETPADEGDIDLGGTAVQVAVGNIHSCALLTTGQVRCWGLNTSGQLGYGNTENIGDDETPADAGDVPLF
jgi:cysteine-rich repeat protein